jgi:hypothetical protein
MSNLNPNKSFQDLIFKLLEVRPREYRPHEFRRKERGDEE